MTGQATLRLLLFVAAVVIGTGNPAAALTVLYNFAGGLADVQNPQPFGDIALGTNGNFYGTAPSGGAHGEGGVFEITPLGAETVPYSFTSTNNPTCQPGLNNYNANYFIGSCYGPAAGSGGGIYSMSLSGAYHLIHKFTGSPLDGANPDGPPIKIGQTIYGTTAYGGTNNLGTIYERIGTGAVTILYSFTGGADGKYPAATLLHELYGTTCTPTTVCLDGSAEGGGGGNCGTIFQFVPPSGPFAVLHTFTCFPGDGTAPIGALIQPAKNGPLYGTTYEGGANNEGIVFRLTQAPPPYVLTLMHSFSAATDGAGPQAALVRDGNYLYGTCINGGNPGGWLNQGEGSIFKIKMTGTFAFTTLHLFAGGTADGSNPAGGLVLNGGLLYGDTVQGGTNNDGVFYSQVP